MPITVSFSEDPAEVLDRAGVLLAADAVRNNVILTLLHARLAHPEPGRYWIASRQDEVVGVVFQSPLSFFATVTPMDGDAVEAVVAAIVATGAELPGVSGAALTAARFAGQWTEHHGSAAHPEEGMRIYEISTVGGPSEIAGASRQATTDDIPLLGDWIACFQEDVGESVGNPVEIAARQTTAGHVWIWEHNGPVSMAAVTPPVGGTARIGLVYTPPQLRNHGYAAASVAELSARTLANGTRCILYTDLGNPVSNKIYRRIGYQAVEEVLRYRFA